MKYRDARDSLNVLFALATGQGGYFTAKQAASAGYDYPHLTYHLHVGNFERASHGLYRLPKIPLSENDDLIQQTLWSRNRDDAPQAVVSHVSALFLHKLSDVLPSRAHFTVPTSFRKPPAPGITLHKSRLKPSDIEQREGFSVTTPLRTICDLSKGHWITNEQLERAIHDAITRGLVRESILKKKLGQGISFFRGEPTAA